MTADADCLFCKIIASEIPCFKLFENDETMAFMDINPANEGHALVIPKEHATDVYAVSDAAITATVKTAKKMAAAIDKTLNPESFLPPISSLGYMMRIIWNYYSGHPGHCLSPYSVGG